jgi:ketosteroid isomerase-like protein
MTASNESLIDRFYAAFADLDGAGMAASYAPDVHFHDPVFTDLHGPEAGAMWRMLTGQAKDLKVELLEREADGERGWGHWMAHYTFSRTGRPVVNDVRATFRFADGLIVDHHDEFDSTAGRARPSARRACCWEARRCFARRSASRPARGSTNS